MWPFSRKVPVPPVTVFEAMNEDWNVGDLAECINDRGWISGLGVRHQNGPEKGDILTVLAIEQGSWKDGVCSFFLAFKGFGQSKFHCAAFRKVPPISEAEQEEFKARIKRPAPEVIVT